MSVRLLTYVRISQIGFPTSLPTLLGLRCECCVCKLNPYKSENRQPSQTRSKILYTCYVPLYVTCSLLMSLSCEKVSLLVELAATVYCTGTRQGETQFIRRTGDLIPLIERPPSWCHGFCSFQPCTVRLGVYLWP